MFNYNNEPGRYVKASLFLLALVLFTFSLNARAEISGITGIGLVANNMLEPVKFAATCLSAMSTMLGIMSLFSGIMRYRQYRKNELAQPLSSVFMLFLMGGVFFVLPLVYKLTESGIAPHG